MTNGRTDGRKDGRTDGRTNNPEAICPSNFFEVGGINMGVNDKVRTDLDLHKGSNLGMVVYAIERSYPKVGVCQI